MPSLRRDVLRWLVALNLSFPIKNIKRDFSNGFMVAEIFSRYFPQDIHMHSYDYGSRLVAKRDNWEQLKKFFRKKGFTVVNDEIDNIINSTSEDGAAPLLERMYNFLTQKPKQLLEEVPADDPPGWSNLQSEDCTPRDDPILPGLSPLEDASSTCDSEIYSESGHELGDSGHGVRLLEYIYDRYQGENDQDDQPLRLGPSGCKYDLQPLERLETEEHDDDLLESSVDDGVRFLDDEDDCEPGQVENEKSEEQDVFIDLFEKRSINAVERARQREDVRIKKLEKEGYKAGLTSTLIKQTIAGRKSRSEAALAFRSPNRSRKMNFKQYTLPDYRRQKQFGYVQLGSLGHKDDPHLITKRQVLNRVKEFGRHARSCNIVAHIKPSLVTPKTPPKPCSRKVALEFASTIPKPKRKKHQCQEDIRKVVPVQNPHTLTDLQILEMKHQSHKQHVEAIRRDLEHFLR